MLVKQQSESQHKVANSVFKTIDRDKTGIIDKDELRIALEEGAQSTGLTKQQSSLEISKIIKEVDYNNDNEINYTEFLAATINPNILSEEKTIEGLFNQFDLDNDGVINKEELVLVFSKFGQEITTEEINIIMKQHDYDNQNTISREEFTVMLTDTK